MFIVDGLSTGYSRSSHLGERRNRNGKIPFRIVKLTLPDSIYLRTSEKLRGKKWLDYIVDLNKLGEKYFKKLILFLL